MVYDSLSGDGFGIFAQLRHQAAVRPDKTFASWDTVKVTYGGLYESINSVANALRELGVRPADRVGIYMHNRAEFVPAMFGIMRAGAAHVPFSTHSAPAEVEYQLNHTQAGVMFVDDDHAPLVRNLSASCPSLQHLVVVGQSAIEGELPLSSLMDASAAEPPLPVPHVDELAAIMYTSGTTSRPKGVMWSHGNLVTAGATYVDQWQWHENDRLLHYFPLYHANGGFTNTLPVIRVGASMVMISRFSVSSFWEQLCRYEITKTNVNITNLRWLLNAPPSPYDRAHSVKVMRVGLKAEAEELAAFEERFGVRVVQAYGLTEGLAITIAQHPTLPPRLGASGRVLRGYSVRLVDDDGNDVSPGSPGEVWIRGHDRHSLSQGYYLDPEKTEEVYGSDGWLRTGDLGYFDAEGYFWFVNRKKDMIKRSGFNVAPAEVERVISSLAGVEDVCVVGIPDPDREQAIVAFVVLAAQSDLTVEKVRAACISELSDFKVPQWIRVVNELPRLPQGKVNRRALFDLALADSDIMRAQTRSRTPG